MRLLQFYTSKRLDKKDSDSLVTYTITKRKISRAASPVLKLIRRRQAEKWEAREQLADIVLKPCWYSFKTTLLFKNDTCIQYRLGMKLSDRCASDVLSDYPKRDRIKQLTHPLRPFSNYRDKMTVLKTKNQVIQQYNWLAFQRSMIFWSGWWLWWNWHFWKWWKKKSDK